MFNAFEYFSTIYASAGITEIYKASGITNVEELLSNIGNPADSCLVVRDSGDGYLDFEDTQLDTGYHTFYVMCRGKFNDHSANLTAKRSAMAKAIALIKLMKADSFDFGDAAYGLTASRIDYSEIGPLGAGFYGYSMSFTMQHEF
jgi:hypothetical protein